MQDSKETTSASKSAGSSKGAKKAEPAKKTKADAQVEPTSEAKVTPGKTAKGIENKSTPDHNTTDQNTGNKSYPNTSTANKSSKPIWLFILLVLVIGVGAYSVWQFQQIQQQFNTAQQQQTDHVEQLKDQRSQVGQLQQALDEQKIQLQSSVKALKKELTNTQAQNKTLTTQIQQLQSHAKIIDGQVSVKEVENLLVKANQRLRIEQNPALAIPFINAAQDLISQTKVLGGLAILEAIAIDLAALESIVYLDVQDAYVRLSGLINQSRKLKLNAVQKVNLNQTSAVDQASEQPLKSTPTDTQVSQTDSATSWLAKVWSMVQSSSVIALNKIGEELKSLVTIRKRDEADNLKISIEQESWQRTQLQQWLVHAQTALLQKQQNIYDDALQQAQAILASYGVNNTQADYLHQEIAKLQVLALVTEVPNVDASLAAVATWQTNAADNKQDKE